MNRQQLIEDARKAGTPFWQRIAEDLGKSSRRRVAVNLSRISRASKAGETVFVAGKVLGDGNLSHNVTVVAHTFSDAARKKLSAAQCEALTIDEFLKRNPNGSGRILG